MRKIKLTQNKVALIDDEDYEKVSKYKWQAVYRREAWYASKTNGPSMHIFILGKRKNKIIDHIDGNGLNNQRKNLRYATHIENGYNCKLYKNNTSGHKGISWHKQHKKWAAQCRVNKKNIHLGYFINKKDAIKTYETFSEKHHKQFKRLIKK